MAAAKNETSPTRRAQATRAGGGGAAVPAAKESNDAATDVPKTRTGMPKRRPG